jgi:hypothetical protein
LSSVMKRNKSFTASQSTCTSDINNKNGISSRFKFDINKLSGNSNAPSLWIISLVVKHEGALKSSRPNNEKTNL